MPSGLSSTEPYSEPGTPGRPVDEGGDSDSQLTGVAGCPPLRLLGSQSLVVAGLESEVQGGPVVAAVEHEPTGVGVGHGRRRDEVATPDLGRVHADLGREQIDRPFHEGAGLRPARAPVGSDLGGVGDHRVGGPGDVGHRVGTGQHGAGVAGQHRGDPAVGAAVVEDVDPEALDPAVPAPADRDVLELSPGVAEPDHVRCTGRCPPDRPATAAGHEGEQQLLGVGSGLGAEAPAHVGGDHPDLARVDAMHRCQPVADRVGSLTGGVEHQPVVGGPGGRRDARLDRTRCQPLVDEPGLDDHLTLVEGHRFLATAANHDVGPRLREEQDLTDEGVLHRHDDWQGLVLDVNQVGRVGRGCGRLGDDRRDRLAHEADHVGGEEGLLHRGGDVREQGRQGIEVDVFAGQHVDHPRGPTGRGCVDRRDPGVGQR